MVVLAVPGLRADDLARPELPTLRFLVTGGAVGWMNCRTARVPGQRREPEEAAYLTLGAGSRATAGPYARVLTPAVLARLKEENRGLDHPVPVGALGDMLHAAGLKTAVIGGEDDAEPRRAATLLAMDFLGRTDVDLTAREYWSRPDFREPSGLRTSLRAYSKGGAAAFQVWVYGDLVRAGRFDIRFPPETVSQRRSAALGRLDVLLASYFRELPPDTRVLLISPAPAESASSVDRLAPIFMFGEGVKPGRLTSGSTQRAGLVTNTDFLPTVAEWFQLRVPPEMIGRPMETATGPQPTPETFAAMHDRWAATAAQQSAFGGVPTLQFALVLIGIALWIRRPVTPSSRHPVILASCHLVTLSILSLPLVQLLLPPVSPAPVGTAGLLMGAVVLAVAAVGALKPTWAWRIGMGLMGALCIAVLLDLGTGGRLMRQAWMSYSVMEGARYYGIGNEYVGAFFASAMIVAGVLSPRASCLTPLILVVLALFVGLPGSGANAGGFLGMAVGIGAAGLIWRRGLLRARDVLTALLLIALLMAVLVLLDLARGGAAQSHIAQAFGGGSILNIIARKAALNSYLLTHSPWTPGLPTSIAGIWLLWRAPSSRMRLVITESAAARGAAVGLLVGASCLFLFNDSGVVCASETLLVAWAAALLYSVSPPTTPINP